MSIEPEVEDFTLSVEFAGICLYVIDPKKERVAVLLPTANGGINPTHEDGTDGARHVAYLRMDLANFDPNVPPGSVPDGPQFEVVRQLRHAEIRLEPEASEDFFRVEPLSLPDLSVYEGKIRLKKNLFTDDDLFPNNPPAELQARMMLTGGTLAATVAGGSISPPKPGRDPAWDTSDFNWAGSVRWTCTIPGDSLTIRIVPLDGSAEPPPLRLVPAVRGTDRVIDLKIANLCESNPLEWRDFERKHVRDDVDFKWLFRLYDPIGARTIRAALNRPSLPYPRLAKTRTAGNQGCTGATDIGP